MAYVSTLLMLFIPYTVLCRYLPPPVNLTMDSRYFVHILTWQAGPGSPKGLQYSVIVRSISKVWKMVEGCEKVHSPLSCNLTNVFSNLQETYYINVTARLGNETSIPTSYSPFNPAKDTLLQSPLLNAEPCNDSLCVHLHSPTERLYNLYNAFTFNLNVTSERGNQFVKTTLGLKNVVLEHLAPGLQYCISVNIKDHLATTSKVCESTISPGNHTDAVISVVLFVVLLSAVFSVLLITSGTICLKVEQPSILVNFQYPFKEHLIFWPSVEIMTPISVEPSKNECIKTDGERDEDRENKVNEVAYERRNGCKEIVFDEGSIEDKSSSFCETNSEIQDENQSNTTNESGVFTPNVLNDDVLVPPHTAGLHWQLKHSKVMSQIFTTPLLPLETKLQGLRNTLDTHKYTDMEEFHMQEKGEDSVNFFSLTIGGKEEEQQKENEKDQLLENVQNVVPLFLSRPVKTCTLKRQSELTEVLMNSSSSEEDEVEEDYSGYMTRN